MSDTKQEAFFGDSDAGSEWATPRRIWKPLADALGGFDLDPAAGCEPIQIADRCFTKEDNGLAESWCGDVWLNPPYGREHNEKWAKKAASEAERGEVNTLTALVPASMGAKWYQENYGTADWETHIQSRVNFIGDGDFCPSFYSVIVTWGDVPKEYINTLHQLGDVRKIVPKPTEQTRLEVDNA